ncbi:4Fe-4S dicluster domain-containing protein [Consotaella salsifontis]|uniref:Electron transport protein HydN n=1 Tax=Consotaella salsifontis TaxID=1365950 RepID=A0A1T4RNN3_9HYPH|nr:4Fe-4S dicluster domain-containing protein [Consotaella salsifontis]SKA17281.1 electron transport protein HydN [Consotaella salsifontis]
MNRFVAADPGKCIGCRTCEIACAMAHRPDGSTEALAPTNFEPRIRVIKTATVSTAVMCHHCEDAPCLNACPEGAIVYRADSVQVDQSRCVGCKNCVMACPFGVMEVITVPAVKSIAGIQVSAGVKARAHKCDLCIDRAAGQACVGACPTNALRLVDEASLQQSLAELRERTAIAAIAV